MKHKRLNQVLQSSFAELGGEMTKDPCGLFFVKCNSMEYFLYLDEKEYSFCILQTVIGQQGKLSKSQFDIMKGVLKEFHNEYDVEWNEGLTYVLSPNYCLRGIADFSSSVLNEIIQEFFDAWAFACANAYLVTDASMCQLKEVTIPCEDSSP